MKITKALITAAGPDQRKLPLQTLVDRDRTKKTVLEVLINEIRSAGIEEIGIVIHPDDEKLGLSESLNDLANRSKYLALEKKEPRYDIGLDYGLLKAQLALSLSGKDLIRLMNTY